MLSTILTSLVTSLIVSLLTFTLGLRTGKNQADRPKLKEIYRKLAVHFEDLKTAIESGVPKTWDNFEKILREKSPNSQSWVYLPVVRAMKQDGTILDLPIVLAQKLEVLEKDLMNFGTDYRQQSFNAGATVIELIQQQALHPPESSAHGTLFGKGGVGTSYTEIYLGKLLIDTVINEVSNRLDGSPQLGLNILALLDNQKFSVILYPDAFSIPLSKIVGNIHEKLVEHQEISDLLQRRKMLLQQINDILRKLTKYVKDPHPYWQTIFAAFRDIFH